MADVRGELLSSVRIADEASSTETDVSCTRLIIAAGAWSPEVFAGLFPGSQSKLPVSSLAGYSLVLRSPRWAGVLEEDMESNRKRNIGCHAVFTTTKSGFAPKIFSRAGGDLYVAGLDSASLLLPRLATEREISAEAIGEMRKVAAELLGAEGVAAGDDDLEVVREGLCFQSVTPYAAPIILRIPDEHLGGGIATRPDAEGSVFLAAGHGPGGISLSLSTGMVLAELCQGRRLSADVRSLGIW